MTEGTGARRLRVYDLLQGATSDLDWTREQGVLSLLVAPAVGGDEMVLSARRVLVLAPHADDAELGCGGSIARFLEQGADLFVAVFSTAKDSIPDGFPSSVLREESIRAMATYSLPPDRHMIFDFPVRRLSAFRQEVLDELIRLKRDIRPELVLAPSGNDLHQDHQVLHWESLRAFKEISLLGYELPWNHATFSAQAFIAVERRHLEAKWKALRCYESQFILQRQYFSWESVESLARIRGLQVKELYAEAFDVFRVKY